MVYLSKYIFGGLHSPELNRVGEGINDLRKLDAIWKSMTVFILDEDTLYVLNDQGWQIDRNI